MKSYFNWMLLTFAAYIVPAVLWSTTIYFWPEYYPGIEPLGFLQFTGFISIVAAIIIPFIIKHIHKVFERSKNVIDLPFLLRDLQKGLWFFVIKWSFIGYFSLECIAFSVPLLYAAFHGAETLNDSIFASYLGVIIFLPMSPAILFPATLGSVKNMLLEKAKGEKKS